MQSCQKIFERLRRKQYDAYKVKGGQDDKLQLSIMCFLYLQK